MNANGLVFLVINHDLNYTLWDMKTRKKCVCSTTSSCISGFRNHLSFSIFNQIPNTKNGWGIHFRAPRTIGVSNLSPRRTRGETLLVLWLRMQGRGKWRRLNWEIGWISSKLIRLQLEKRIPFWSTSNSLKSVQTAITRTQKQSLRYRNGTRWLHKSGNTIVCSLLLEVARSMRSTTSKCNQEIFGIN